jgi:hypothetical protein
MRLTTADDSTPVRVSIYDGVGRLVRTLFERPVAREMLIEWDGRDAAGGDVASGVYFMRAQQGERALTHRVIVLR